MPQMKPMNWLILISYVFMTYLFMSQFLYFFDKKYLNDKSNKTFKCFKFFNLKW